MTESFESARYRFKPLSLPRFDSALREKFCHGIARSPLAPSVAKDCLAMEIAELPPNRKLDQLGDLGVYLARGDELPNVLPELGRLRELTFRAVGEGTGTPADIDEFDPHYLQLFLWNEVKKELVGGYRLGVADSLMRRFGTRGLYTSSLFDYQPQLLEELGSGLEMGRSFVRPEYQRGLAPMLLLWKGIGRYVVRQPWSFLLFGPVSISADYTLASRSLIVSFLAERHLDERRGALVAPRCPFVSLRTRGFEPDKIVQGLGSIEELSALVADIEPDGKGVPILISHYLKLGAKVLGFNVDPSFGHVVDALIAVDLRQTNPKILGRYMGMPGARSFFEFHRVDSALNGDGTTSAAR